MKYRIPPFSNNWLIIPRSLLSLSECIFTHLIMLKGDNPHFVSAFHTQVYVNTYTHKQVTSPHTQTTLQKGDFKCQVLWRTSMFTRPSESKIRMGKVSVITSVDCMCVVYFAEASVRTVLFGLKARSGCYTALCSIKFCIISEMIPALLRTGYTIVAVY